MMTLFIQTTKQIFTYIKMLDNQDNQIAMLVIRNNISNLMSRVHRIPNVCIDIMFAFVI